MTRRNYTDEDRKKAVEMCKVRPIAQVERETGISRPTLYNWCEEEEVERFRTKVMDESDNGPVFDPALIRRALTSLAKSRNIPKVAAEFNVQPSRILQWYREETGRK